MRSLRVLVTALFLSAHIVSTAAPTQATSVVEAPQITYLDQTGLRFVATRAIWSTPTTSKFQWFVDGKAVPGAIKLTFRTTKKNLNKTIQFRESTSTQLVASSVIARIGHVIVNRAPSIYFSNDAKKGLTVKPGKVSPKSAKASYQWYRGFIDIAGQTRKVYPLATADQGTKVSVNVKYSAKGFQSFSINSNEIDIPLMKRTYLELWREEFDTRAGSYPDPTFWSSEDGDGSNTAAGNGWGNRERQYYIPQLAKTTSQGTLRVEATTEGASEYNCYYKGGCEWISAKYITKGKLEFKYGRIEARIKGPVGAGTWGAFWMLGADIDSRRWPWCGEIDVTELVGKDPNLVYGYLHGLLSGGNGGRGETVQIPEGFSNDFHIYAVDWLPDQINWYLDGVLYGSQSKIDKDWVFDHEFYLILNLAMGGNLGGPIDSNLKYASMEIDWIKFSSINGIGKVIKH